MQQCIFWNHLEPWDIYIEKVPEWVVFCLECAEKYPDEKRYDNGEWRVVWRYAEMKLAYTRWFNPKIT